MTNGVFMLVAPLSPQTPLDLLDKKERGHVTDYDYGKEEMIIRVEADSTLHCHLVTITPQLSPLSR